MKTLIFTGLLFLLCITTNAQRLSIPEQRWLLSYFSRTNPQITQRSIDSTLNDARYWAVTATYDGKDLETSFDVYHMSYKFKLDGRVYIGDDYTSEQNVVRGKWSFDRASQKLTINVNNGKLLVFKVVMLNNLEMLIQDANNKKYMLIAASSYFKVPDGLGRLIFREKL